MSVVDDAVLALMQATDVSVHDGLVLTTQTPGAVVVSYTLPDAVYYSSIGDDDNRRLSGRKTRRSVFFQVTYVGKDRDQVKWAGEQIRAALQGARPIVAGHRTGLIDLEASQRIRRDDDAIRPDGSPLFYGVDEYAVSIFTLNPAA